MIKLIDSCKRYVKKILPKLQRMKNTQSIKLTTKNNRLHYEDYYEYYEYDDDFYDYLNHQKKIIFFLYIYKMVVKITKETFGNNDIEAIIDGVNTLWLNERHIEKKLSHKNLPSITNKYDIIYKKCRCELVNEPIKQPNRRFLRNDLALKIIMDCRTDESCNLKKK